jgi:hypothetical protein
MIAAGVVVAFQLDAPSFTVPETKRAGWRRTAHWFGLGVIGFLAVTVGIAIQQQGGHETLVDLLQFRTRDDRSEYGTHWQYHLLHLLDAIGFSLALAWLVRGLSGRTRSQPEPGRERLLAIWFAVFASLVLIFRPTLRPFNDPLYLAHQFREIATGRVLLLPVIFGLLFALEQRALGETGLSPIRPARIWQGLIMLVVATGIPLWIYWQLRSVNVGSLAQRRAGLLELYAAHNFEHCLDVIFAMLLAGWLYFRLLLRESVGNHPSTDTRST